MRTRPRHDPIASRLRHKLAQLRLLSPRDHRAIEEIVDDTLKYRLAHIETTQMWKGPKR